MLVALDENVMSFVGEKQSLPHQILSIFIKDEFAFVKRFGGEKCSVLLPRGIRLHSGEYVKLFLSELLTFGVFVSKPGIIIPVTKHICFCLSEKTMDYPMHSVVCRGASIEVKLKTKGGGFIAKSIELNHFRKYVAIGADTISFLEDSPNISGVHLQLVFVPTSATHGVVRMVDSSQKGTQQHYYLVTRQTVQKVCFPFLQNSEAFLKTRSVCLALNNFRNPEAPSSARVEIVARFESIPNFE